MSTSIKRDLAQQIVQTVKDVCGKDVNFIDSSGVIFASTQEERLNTYHEIGRKVAQSGRTIEVKPKSSSPVPNPALTCRCTTTRPWWQ